MKKMVRKIIIVLITTAAAVVLFTSQPSPGIQEAKASAASNTAKNKKIFLKIYFLSHICHTLFCIIFSNFYK
ncbi:MAG: hypothetical protein LBC76_05290 [Treponema sp.]|jgi:hypothetical protein|nr:hypothetical protein [Treponema sp.]